MNAFSAVNYRWTFVIIIINILSFSFSLDYLIKNKKLNFNLFSIIFLIYSLILILLFNISNYNIIYFLINIFLILYFINIIFIFKYKNKLIPQILLIILIAAELIYASYAVINFRELVDGRILKEKKGYFDYTNDAVSYLNKTDDESNRIEKSYFSVQLRDALMQNYKGTTACNSLNNPGTTEFYHHLKIPFLFGVVCNISGFDSRQNIQTLAGREIFFDKNRLCNPFWL